MKRLVHQEDIIILNQYVPCNRVSQAGSKFLELKGEIDKFSIIVGNFNTSLSLIDRSSRFFEIFKNTENMNTINQLNLIDIQEQNDQKWQNIP